MIVVDDNGVAVGIRTARNDQGQLRAVRRLGITDNSKETRV